MFANIIFLILENYKQLFYAMLGLDVSIRFWFLSTNFGIPIFYFYLSSDQDFNNCFYIQPDKIGKTIL